MGEVAEVSAGDVTSLVGRYHVDVVEPRFREDV
jgi:hypothetical protein